MREKGQIWWVRILCIVWFGLEVSRLSYTGIREMFPVYVYGSYEEEWLWDEIIKEQIHAFLPVYEAEKRYVVLKTRRDSFTLKRMEQSEMLTLMELENNRLGQEIHIEVPRPTNPPEKNEVTKQEQIARINLEELEEYETLVKRFYTIDAITNIGPEELNAKKLGNMDLTMKQTADQPQILIYHTHSQEAYADSVPGDDTTTIMGVGEHLAEILEKKYGYNVIHHIGKYDVQSRDNAYSKALPEIKRVLEENPSIEVVIDLHRDAVADETRLVMDLDGRPTAKFMFFNGISRTTKTGKIDYLHNPNLETNLAFSFQAKWRAEEYYPGLTRRNYINAYRYNMHLSPKAMLLELGAQNNTLEEAMNACEPIAHILHIVLSGEF